MLKFFNRLEKTRNFFILIFGVLMVASLVFWGGSGIQSNASVDPSRSTETAAKVSGEEITVGELYRQKQMYSRYSQGRPYPAKLLLDGMIASRITRVEAARLVFFFFKQKTAYEIREEFKTEDGKPFDQTV